VLYARSVWEFEGPRRAQLPGMLVPVVILGRSLPSPSLIALCAYWVSSQSVCLFGSQPTTAIEEGLQGLPLSESPAGDKAKGRRQAFQPQVGRAAKGRKCGSSPGPSQIAG
jgi:hypothetical protein